MMNTTICNTEDVIDSRDVIEALTLIVREANNEEVSA